MEARLFRVAILVAAFFSLGASYRTTNFVVSAPTPRLAEKIGQSAEKFRRDLAIEWLGHELPRWPAPCPITAQVAPHLGAGGATSFVFQNGQVGSWRMSIQGSEVRILDSVLPHEVTHTIFATHFRQPLPRWADEGGCTTVEHPSEKARHQQMLIQFLQTNRGIAFSRMFAMKEYPSDVLPLYAQGFSLARYLIEQGGKRKYVDFIATGLRSGDWIGAVKHHYKFQDLGRLQNQWLGWVRSGSPALNVATDQPSTTQPVVATAGPPQPVQVARNDKRQRPQPNLIYRLREAPATPVQGQAVANTAANPQGAGQDRWRASGQSGQRNVAASTPPRRGTPPGAANRHQAVRQQPAQAPVQRVIE